MILYRKIVKREGVEPEQILEELYAFTSWGKGDTTHIINDYLFFAYAINVFPEKYDDYAKLFDTTTVNNMTLENIQFEDLMDMTGEYSNKYLNHLIVDKPFRTLVSANPDKVPHFLEIIGSLSLYHYSKASDYKKSVTWVEKNGNYLNDYMKYIKYIANTYDFSEVLSIYMNSPLKSLVDFSYVIRLLFRPENGYRDLTKELENYTFRGRLLRNDNKDEKTSYLVSLSNVCCSYRFPIHHSWASQHAYDLDKNYNEGDTVQFEIMSVNNKGMIFAYNISQKKQQEKNEVVQAKNKSVALKNLVKIKEGTLPQQGKNVEENIRLFSLAMICDDDKILVETATADDENIECLPYLPVANNESSDKTIKRLLKYFLGFHGNISLAPCGIRHLCTREKRRSIFFIYRIELSALRNAQQMILWKESMKWKSIEEYRTNIQDSLSESFVCALDSKWSEQTLNIG